MIFLSGACTVYTGVLNAAERFALGAIAPAIVPVAAFVAIAGWGGRFGIEAVAVGTVGGYLLNAVFVARGVTATGVGILPRWPGLTPELRRVIAQYLPVAAGACLLSSTGIVDQAMASMLPSGSVAVLNYGNKSIALLTNLGTAALGTAVLPHFSRMFAHADWRGLRHSLRTWGRLILATTVPLTVVFMILSGPLVALVFERGAFTARDTTVVASVQAMYLLQIPFYTHGIQCSCAC
jgi:putative peptidoglycan lipid II flippase